MSKQLVLRELKYTAIERAKLQLLNLPPEERYALMEDRLMVGNCPNCDIKMNRLTKMYKCSHCGFVADGDWK